jgi:acyl carrier protein
MTSPTDSADLRARTKRLIVERLHLEGLAPDEIGDDEPLFGDGLGLDSVDTLELLLGLEQEFGLKIQSDQIEREAFRTVATLAEFVRARLSEQKAAGVA